MLEIILLVIAGAILVSFVQRAPATKALVTEGVVQTPKATVRPTINIEGTHRFEAPASFVSKFGFNPAQVASVNMLKGNASFDALPLQAQEALKQIFVEGGTRGPDIAQYIYNKAPLAASDTVYFVLTAGRQGNALCAFIDQSRG